MAETEIEFVGDSKHTGDAKYSPSRAAPPPQKPEIELGFKIGSIKLPNNDPALLKIKVILDKFKDLNAQNTLKHKARSHAISADATAKFANAVANGIDTPATVIRGSGALSTLHKLQNTAWNFAYTAHGNPWLLTNTFLISLIYPLIHHQLTIEEIKEERLNKDPERLFKKFFLENPTLWLEKMQANLDALHKKDEALKNKYDSLKLKYQIVQTGNESTVEFYLCIDEKRPSPQKTGVLHFLIHHVKNNFLGNLEDAAMLTVLIYWLYWLLGGIVLFNSYNYIVPGNIYLSTFIAIVIPLGVVALIYAKKVFIWIENHFDMPESGGWNKWIKPFFDHPARENWLNFSNNPFKSLVRLPFFLIALSFVIIAMPFVALGALGRSASVFRPEIKIWDQLKKLPGSADKPESLTWNAYFRALPRLLMTFAVRSALAIIFFIPRTIATLFGVSGKENKDVWVVAPNPDLTDPKYRDTFIFVHPDASSENLSEEENDSDREEEKSLKSPERVQNCPLRTKLPSAESEEEESLLLLEENLISNCIYYVNPDGLKSPNPIRHGLVLPKDISIPQNKILSGKARQWAHLQIAKNNKYAKKANSAMAEKFAEIMRKLAVLIQYDTAEKMLLEREKKDNKESSHSSTQTPQEGPSAAAEAPLTSWNNPLQPAKPLELLRFFWLTFLGKVIRFEYQLWLTLVLLTYMHIITQTGADHFLNLIITPGSTIFVISAAIMFISFIYAVVKTFYGFEEEKSYREGKNDLLKEHSAPIYVIDRLPENIPNGSLFPKEYADSYVLDKKHEIAYYLSSTNPPTPTEIECKLSPEIWNQIPAEKFGNLPRPIRLEERLDAKNQQTMLPALCYALEKGHRAILKDSKETPRISTILNEQTLLQKIATQKEEVAKKEAQIAWQEFKLKKAGHLIPPRPLIPNATDTANLASVKRKNNFSSALLGFLKNPYWVLLATIGVAMINSIFAARILSLGNTGVTTHFWKLGQFKYFNAHPILITGFIFTYILFHTGMGYYKDRQDEANTAKKRQYALAPLQSIALEKQLAQLKEYEKSLPTLSATTNNPLSSENAAIAYNDLYPPVSLSNFAKQINWRDKGVYLLAGLALTSLLAVFALSFVPTFASLLLSGGLALWICTPLTMAAIVALGLHFFAKDHTLVPREKKMTVILLGALTLSLMFLLILYAAPITVASNILYFSFLPVFAAGVFFTSTFKKEQGDISLANEFWEGKKGEIENILSPTPEAKRDISLAERESKDSFVLLQGKNKELMIHAMTLLKEAMNPNGAARRIDPTFWGAPKVNPGEKRPVPSPEAAARAQQLMLDNFMRLQHLREKIKNDEPISSAMLKEISSIQQHYDSAQLQTKVVPREKPAANQDQIVEAGSLIFLLFFGFLSVYLPAVFLPPAYAAWQWLPMSLLILCTLPRLAVEFLIEDPVRDVWLMAERPNARNTKFILGKFFVLFEKQLFHIDKSRDLPDKPFKILGENHYKQLQANLGFTELNAGETKKLVGNNISCVDFLIDDPTSELWLMSEKPTLTNTANINRKAFILLEEKLFHINKSQVPAILTTLPAFKTHHYEQLKTNLGFTELTAGETQKCLARKPCEALLAYQPKEKNPLTNHEKVKQIFKKDVIWLLSIKTLTTAILTSTLLTLLGGGIIFPIIAFFTPMQPYAAMSPWLLGSLIPISLFLMQATLKYLTLIINDPKLEPWVSAASKFFLAWDIIAFGTLALALPTLSFLLLTGVFTVPATLGLIAVLCALPASFFIFKVLLPQALVAHLVNEKDDPKTIVDHTQEIENACKNIAYGLSGIMFIASTVLVGSAGFPISLVLICGTWVGGLVVGHYGWGGHFLEGEETTGKVMEGREIPFSESIEVKGLGGGGAELVLRTSGSSSESLSFFSTKTPAEAKAPAPSSKGSGGAMFNPQNLKPKVPAPVAAAPRGRSLQQGHKV